MSRYNFKHHFLVLVILLLGFRRTSCFVGRLSVFTTTRINHENKRLCVLADRESLFSSDDLFHNHQNINGNHQLPPQSNGAEVKPSNGFSLGHWHNSSHHAPLLYSHHDDAETAPEVNQWTTIMSREYLLKESETDLAQFYQDLRDMSNYDAMQVEGYWSRLMPTVSYLGTERVARVYNALLVAYRAHRGQLRKSGEPFIVHPLEVALLLSGLKMDAETVMAGLLHDTVEDTDLTFSQIEEMFGPTVRSIVEGETKVSKLPKLAFEGYADEQAENLRQLFIAMTDDYRIIIVKLADRLHNMRTLQHMKPEKQIKISRETLDIFAPLAHRMGIWQFKSELEDIAFQYLYPKEYRHLKHRLQLYQNKFQQTLEQSQGILSKTLKADPTLQEQAESVQVYGRTKELYSLWYKMETKDEKDLNHIVDVVALRVIITPKQPPDGTSPHADRGVWLCYHVLGLVQHLPGFQAVPTRVKDYISFPKPNGYQSLHTALMLNGQTIEVQIRTHAMHQVAEYGMASHWAYMDEKRRKKSGSHEALFSTPWLSSIKEWQKDSITARDFVESVRNELLGKRVFVFLRNGKILNLARGATAIDAAFAIHTQVGLTMHGVEINGKPVPFSYILRNGDVVSILTGKGRPQTDWIEHAKSRSTRSELRAYFRQKEKESFYEAGKILLMDYLWIHGPLIEKYSYLTKSFTVPATVSELEAFLPGKTRYQYVADLLIDVGKKHDRAYLHSVISKLFLVPQTRLAHAEKNRPIPSSITAKIHENIQDAEHAAHAADSANHNVGVYQYSYAYPNATTWKLPENVEAVNGEVVSNGAENKNGAAVPKAANGVGTTSITTIGESDKVEYADYEHLCEKCLPILGDEVIGTRPWNRQVAVTTVHRVGCPHAQSAVNQARASMVAPNKGVRRVDSWTLRTRTNGRAVPLYERPVPLQWPDLSLEEKNKITFLTEVFVVAQDRKQLLADCSEIVSEHSEIVKSGSVTTDEHATLLFLIRVSSLSHLQDVMDRLGEVPSVMSVERGVSSFQNRLNSVASTAEDSHTRIALSCSLEANSCEFVGVLVFYLFVPLSSTFILSLYHRQDFTQITTSCKKLHIPLSQHQ
jgi:GTP pyrophosphokinase